MILGLGSCNKFEFEENADKFIHIKVDGVELPVRIKGNTASKRFIVYINGGPGLTSIDKARTDVYNWSENLEEQFAMVYYDQRGCGNAQGNIDESTLTVQQYAKDLDAIVNFLISTYPESEIFLMGHSFGGFIGANYLLNPDYQEKIEAWISIDGAYNFDFDLSWEYRRAFLANIAQIEIALGNDIKHWKTAQKWLALNLNIVTQEQKDKWREFIGAPGEIIIPLEETEISVRQHLGIGFASSYNPFPAFLSKNYEIVNEKLNQSAETIDLLSKLSDIMTPSLFISGRYDDIIVPEESTEVFKLFGTPEDHKRFILFYNSSHEPFISDHYGFTAEVIDFVYIH